MRSRKTTKKNGKGSAIAILNPKSARSVERSAKHDYDHGQRWLRKTRNVDRGDALETSR